MDNLTEFALMFKNRDPKKVASMTTGTVISSWPNVKIQLNDSIILDKDYLIATQMIYSRTLNVGDEVILMPTVDEQQYFLIDVARRLT